MVVQTYRLHPVASAVVALAEEPHPAALVAEEHLLEASAVEGRHHQAALEVLVVEERHPVALVAAVHLPSVGLAGLVEELVGHQLAPLVALEVQELAEPVELLACLVVVVAEPLGLQLGLALAVRQGPMNL